MKAVNEILNLNMAYAESIDRQIKDLEEQKAKMARNCEVARVIVFLSNDIFKKLHLTIEEFSVSHPLKNGQGMVSFYLKSDGNFKFIPFAGYDSKGRGRNRSKLETKARKMEEKITEFIDSENLNISCNVNEYSLESKEGNKETVLIEIFYDL